MNDWRTLFAAAVDVDILRITGPETMRSLKRLLHVALASTVLPTPHVSAAESAYPSKPLRLIVPYAPGGGVDGVGRLILPRTSRRVLVNRCDRQPWWRWRDHQLDIARIRCPMVTPFLWEASLLPRSGAVKAAVRPYP
jgi:hypothetical protein